MTQRRPIVEGWFLNIFGENFSKIWEFLNFKILVALHYC